MTGQVCPECGMEREPTGRSTGRPACACALRAERSAEVAASEDFDPLRIRPYVTLENLEGGDGGPTGTTDAPGTTMPLRPVAPGATMPLPPIPQGARGTARQAPTGPQTNPGQKGARPATADPHPTERTRRRPLLLALAAAAAIAALGTTAFASGLFGGGSDDKATGAATTVSTAPYGDDTTSSAPSPTAPAPTRSTPRTSPSPHKSSPSPSRTPKPSTSPSRRPAAPSPSSSQVTGSVDTTTAPVAPPATAPVLRRGDDGPEVAELQDRLAQLTIYNGKADGHFGSKTESAVRTYQSYMGLEDDPPGVYGAETRSALEAQTS
ncbi:peptidoglycan-binding protein [Streptomyces sp. NBC_00648]|uniref:peptidoglycan-binding protein n=1 Tax=Streptomyces sp. NBC_00648 TaxID=2975797 RepID=UPI00324F60D2